MRFDEPEHLRIMALIAEDPHDGAGYGRSRYASELHRALGALHHQVCVISPERVDDGPDPPPGVTFHGPPGDCPVRHHDPVGQAVFANTALTAAALRVIERGQTPDFVLAYGWPTAQAAEAIHVVTGAPLIAVLHDTVGGLHKGDLQEPRPKYAAELEGWMCQRATSTIVPSRALGDELARAYVGISSVYVVPPGVRPEKHARPVHLPDFRALFARSDEKLLLFVGRLVPENGLDVLLDAFGGMRRDKPACSLVIAGDGPLRAALESQVQSSAKLAGAVRFTGHLRGIALTSLYRSADALILPSRYSPMRLAALEGAAHGLPLVLTNEAGPLEALKSYHRRWVEPVGDVGRLAKAASEALDAGGRWKVESDALGLPNWIQSARTMLRRIHARHLLRG